WESVTSAYIAMFRGSVYDFEAATFAMAIKPLTESVVFAIPLILAGLGIAVGFRAGLFNIGAQGQIIVGAIVASYLGFAWSLPVGLHLLLAALGGLIGGALYAAIPGVLKARFGANEVIVTIMLNYIAVYLIAYTLKQPVFNPGRSGQRSRTARSRPHRPGPRPRALADRRRGRRVRPRRDPRGPAPPAQAAGDVAGRAAVRGAQGRRPPGAVAPRHPDRHRPRRPVAH